jgi:hypothetical protein
MKKKEWLFRVANSLGCKVVFEPNWQENAYQNGTISLDFHPSQVVKEPEKQATLIAEALAHELGHFVVAPAGRRYRKNYGILNTITRDSQYWELDEAKARMVEVALLRHVGIKGNGLQDLTQEYQRRVSLWWEKEGKHLVAGLLLIK